MSKDATPFKRVGAFSTAQSGYLLLDVGQSYGQISLNSAPSQAWHHGISHNNH